MGFVDIARTIFFGNSTHAEEVAQAVALADAISGVGPIQPSAPPEESGPDAAGLSAAGSDFEWLCPAFNVLQTDAQVEDNIRSAVCF
jgi:hypothetical protein